MSAVLLVGVTLALFSTEAMAISPLRSKEFRFFETTGGQAVTAASVRALATDSKALASVSPALKNCGTGGCDLYLSALSCLGPFGPIGAYGVTGSLGPLGSNAWAGFAQKLTAKAHENPYNKKATSWSEMFAKVEAEALGPDGPLGAKGPLGPSGPLGASYDTVMPKINDFAAHLALQGVWTVLGPLGPLGALGPLGPLGPKGPRGASANEKGNFIDSKSKKVVRTVEVPWTGGATRTYPFFEQYSEAVAAAMDFSEQDSSWYVAGSLGFTPGSSDSFRFHSDVDQFITILVTPDAQLDSITLKVTDGTSKKLVAASEVDSVSTYINWVQFSAKKGQKFTVTVTLASTGHVLPAKPYHLYTVGSTQYFNQPKITGAHVVKF